MAMVYIAARVSARDTPVARVNVLTEEQALALGFVTEEEFVAWLEAGSLHTLQEFIIDERCRTGKRLGPPPNPRCPHHPPAITYRIDPMAEAAQSVWRQLHGYGWSVVNDDGSITHLKERPPCICPKPVPA